MWIWSKKSRHSSIAANRLKQIQQRWWKTLPHGSGLFWRMAQTFLALLCFCHRYLGSFWNDFYNVWQLLKIWKQPWIVWSYFISLSSPWVHVRLEALTHYTQNCIKSSYLHYTLQLFVTTAATFSTVLYMGNNFRNDFFRRIFAVLCVVV